MFRKYIRAISHDLCIRVFFFFFLNDCIYLYNRVRKSFFAKNSAKRVRSRIELKDDRKYLTFHLLYKRAKHLFFSVTFCFTFEEKEMTYSGDT